MKILLLGFSALKAGFEELGHEVVTCCTTDETSDIWISEFPVDISCVLERLPSGWDPDCILLTDESTEPMFLGLERLDVLLVWYVFDSHLHLHWHKAYAAIFDFVFVAQQSFVSHYEFDANRQVVQWLPLFCNPNRDRYGQLPKIDDVSFVGTLDAQRKPGRTQFINALQERTPLFVTSGEYVSVFNRSKIVLNECAANEVNFRTFEALACGSFLLTEQVENGFNELFENEKHLVTYDKGNLDQVVELIQYYLDHESERERIAFTGREAVLQLHTMTHRAKTIVEHIQIADVQSLIMMRKSCYAVTLNALSFVYEHVANVYEVASQRYSASLSKYEYCLRVRDMYLACNAKIIQSSDRRMGCVGPVFS